MENTNQKEFQDLFEKATQGEHSFMDGVLDYCAKSFGSLTNELTELKPALLDFRARVKAMEERFIQITGMQQKYLEDGFELWKKQKEKVNQKPKAVKA